MKDEIRINPKAISYVVVYIKRKCYDVSFQEGRKRRFLPDIKEGFYVDFFSFLNNERKLFTKDEILKEVEHIYIDINVAFYEPHIEIVLNSKKSFTKYFGTASELTDFVSNNFSDIQLIGI